MQHRYAVHAISRFIEHYGNGIRADDATAGWFAPLRDAVLAAESEVVPVVDDAEQAEALVRVALDLIDLSLTGPGLDKPHRKAREAVRRYLERIGEVVVDRERVRNEIQTARDGLLGEVLKALGHQGGTRQQALDEIRRLRAAGEALRIMGQGPESVAQALAGQDAQETWSGSLADLPIGSVTAFLDGTYATVRQPYGWDLATDSEGTALHVSSADCGYVPSGEVVLVGTGEIPEEWTWTYEGVAALVQDWVARRNEAFRKAGEAVPVENVVRIKTLAAALLAEAEAAALQAETQPGNQVDVVDPSPGPAPEPGQWIHDKTPSVDPDDDCPL